MILSKMLINQIVNLLVKNFKLDKIKDYVFDDNELDKTSKNHENRLRILESIAHPQRDFVVCNSCKNKIKEK
tara:strand:+ start:182 stop:397 length:216 start_codon:yes stop_codon:yes gene_type:complete